MEEQEEKKSIIAQSEIIEPLLSKEYVENELSSLNIDEENVQQAENEESLYDSDSDNYYEEKRKLLGQTKIVKQTWSLQEIYQKYIYNQLVLDPIFQRQTIWDGSKRTAFIESLFMGITIPPVYVVEIKDNVDTILNGYKYEVVDGKQRLSSIVDFLNSEYALDDKSLEYYKDWIGGKTFKDLQHDKPYVLDLIKELMSSVLDVYVITAKSPESTKYDIFARLNQGAEKLRVNELRRALYKSYLTEYIDDFLSEYIVKDKKNITEMTDKQELYMKLFSKQQQLRYEDYGKFYASIAFYINTNLSTCKVDGYNSRPREMINSVLHNAQREELIIDQDEVNKILECTINFKKLVFDKFGYKIYRSMKLDDIINSCIPFIKNYYDQITSAFLDICTDPRISETLEKSAKTTSHVENRLIIISKILRITHE